jgi:hypothetical protein
VREKKIAPYLMEVRGAEKKPWRETERERERGKTDLWRKRRALVIRERIRPN